VDGFEDLTEVGRGRHGVVYRATQLVPAREVALKILEVEAPVDDAEFASHCEAVGAVSKGRNAAAMYEVGRCEDGRLYVVSEFINDGSLLDRTPMAWQEAVRIGIRLALVLDVAHQGGVLHGDVSPRNVLFTAKGEPKLTDFVLVSVGTEPDGASDVYGLAATIYTAISGREPGGKPKRLMDVPQDVRDAIDVALSDDPLIRPSAAGLAHLLEMALGETIEDAVDEIDGVEPEPEEERVPAPTPLPVLPQRGRRAAAVVAALLLIAAVTHLVSHKGDRPVLGSRVSAAAPTTTTSLGLRPLPVPTTAPLSVVPATTVPAPVVASVQLSAPTTAASKATPTTRATPTTEAPTTTTSPPDTEPATTTTTTTTAPDPTANQPPTIAQKDFTFYVTTGQWTTVITDNSLSDGWADPDHTADHLCLALVPQFADQWSIQGAACDGNGLSVYSANPGTFQIDYRVEECAADNTCGAPFSDTTDHITVTFD
jgi:hypothetical protein